MKKAAAFLLASVGLLALVGAGCNNEPSTENTPNNENQGAVTTTTSTEETTTTSPEASSGFNLTVTQDDSGKVLVSWTVPENFGKTNSFRVLHSAKPNPDSPTAFWYQYMNSARQTELEDVPKGKRYFRLCEYDLTANKCVNYSNEVEIDVK